MALSAEMSAPWWKTAAARRRQTQTIIREKMDSTSLLSSLTLSGGNSPRLASSLFPSSSVSVATQREVNSGSPSVTVKPLPWVRRRWRRRWGPHLLQHLSTINFLWWLLWRTEQEQRCSFSVSGWQRKQQEDETEWLPSRSVQMLLSVCLFVTTSHLHNVYIKGMFYSTFYLLLGRTGGWEGGVSTVTMLQVHAVCSVTSATWMPFYLNLRSLICWRWTIKKMGCNFLTGSQTCLY